MAARKDRKPSMSSRFQGLLISNLVFTDIKLGKGADATVHEVEWNGTMCASKRLHDILLEDESPGGADKFISNFETECLTWSKLRHPNVVQFLGVYLERGSRLPVLIMEKMDTSLRQYLESHSKEDFPLGLKAFVLRQVAQALAYLHSQNPPLVHHDLSPNNVLLNKVSFITKISDFGMSRAINQSILTRKSSIKGTLAFMAPEALHDPPQYNKKLDVFSFGNVILHTLTHEWPNPGPPTRYQGDVFVAITEFQRRERFIEKFSAEEKQLLLPTVRSCLENRPDKRPSSVMLVQEMRRIESSLPKSGHVAAPIEQLYQQLAAKGEECMRLNKALKGKDEVIRETKNAVKVKDEELEQLYLAMRDKDKDMAAKDFVIRSLRADNQQLRNQTSQTTEGRATAMMNYCGGGVTSDRSAERMVRGRGQHLRKYVSRTHLVRHYVIRDWRSLGECRRIIEHSPEGSRYFAVAVNREGLLAVTDGGNNCVQLLTKEGTLVRTIGKGVLGGGFLYSVVYHLYAGTLVGVAFDAKGHLWVSTGLSGKVVKLSQDGRLLRTLQHAGSESDKLNPFGLSVSPEGMIFICDCNKHRITVHDEEGTFLFTFGSKGSGPSCLDDPQDVAFGSDGLVYVTDANNERVCVWSKDGTSVRNFKTKRIPARIAATSDGHLLITSSCVMVYTLQGEMVHEFGRIGSYPGEFDMPMGICVDSTGLVYVVDHKNKRVQVF